MKSALKEKPEVIAIIPARGGSKGIPRKNIVDLCGKPLVAYSILAARHAELIDRVVVSTEDEEIAEVAKAWGAEVPFLRPKELAKDTSGIGEAISYTVSRPDPLCRSDTPDSDESGLANQSRPIPAEFFIE
jgi:CMP-N-acetylneuraminic acid synthetase